MKTVCCVCRKAKGSKGWNGKEIKQFNKVTFGVCPNCYSDTLSKIKDNYTASVPKYYGTMVPRKAEVSN